MTNDYLLTQIVPKGSIIVVNHAKHVICTIWQLLRFFSVLWLHITHTPLTYSHVAQTHPTHSKTCPNHPNTHHNPYTYLHRAPMPITYSNTTPTPPTQKVITCINSIWYSHTCNLHWHHYTPLNYMYIGSVYTRTFQNKKNPFLSELYPDT